MGAAKIGEIALDLVVNQKKFDAQMSGITNRAKKSTEGITRMAKKAGAVLGAAFATKKIVDFGKSCIDLGSDLAEVQNVVDVTFPRMTARVDEFAKSAASSFGLSETMAKRFTGTFGAMAKAFGFSEKQAYDMGTTLTGLAGDIASFYNISQDEAYTKLKSVFTGETESLKDLGVVMTQSALDSYALANGFDKTTKAMTEAEKVALRYQFVQSQLSAAQGDFARTSDSWANQMRILSLQSQSIMATIGQGLINLFTPVIKVLNVVLGKVATLANAFKAFTELLMGGKGSSSSSKTITDMGTSAGGASDGLDRAASSAAGMSDAAKTAGAAAKKAAKDMRALMGFDEINKISESSDSTGGGGGNYGSAGGGARALGEAVDFGNLAQGEPIIGKMDRLLDKLIGRVRELEEFFRKGFVIGFGDSEKKIESIIKSVKEIGSAAISIITDPSVIGSFNGLLDAWVEKWGKTVGAFARIGLTVSDNLIGGIEKYLDQSSDYIRERLCSIFDVSADIERMKGDIYVVITDIFDVFSGDTAKQYTADLIGVFTDGFLGIKELSRKFSRDVLTLVVVPLQDNVERIKGFFEDMLRPISAVLSTMHTALRDTFSSIGRMYDEHVKPMVDSFASGISSIVGALLEGFHNNISPVLDMLAERFDIVWKEYVQPAIEKTIDFLGNVADGVRQLWEEVLQPFLEWAAETIFPVIAPIVEAIGMIFINTFGLISQAVGNLMDILSVLLDFLVGVFTGNWEQAWTGVKDFFTAVWTGILDFLKTIWESIKTVFAPVTNWFIEKFRSAVTGIKNVFSSIGSFFSGVWSGIKNTFNNVVGWFREKFTSAWTAVKNVFSTGGKIFDGIKDGILNGLKAVVNAIIGGINKVVAVPFNGINSALRAIKKVNILGIKPFSWISEIPVPQIPKLAEGGYAKKNTPQLAMIGDNRHQGEVVAPDEKLQEMALMAAQMSGAGSSEVIKLLRQLIDLVKSVNGDTVLYVGNEELARAAQKGRAKLQRRYSTVEFE